jgi:hypothetical protein
MLDLTLLMSDITTQTMENAWQAHIDISGQNMSSSELEHIIKNGIAEKRKSLALFAKEGQHLYSVITSGHHSKCSLDPL